MAAYSWWFSRANGILNPAPCVIELVAVATFTAGEVATAVNSIRGTAANDTGRHRLHRIARDGHRRLGGTARAIPSARLVLFWRAVRAADGASLENWWAEMSLGFESLALRTRNANQRPFSHLSCGLPTFAFDAVTRGLERSNVILTGLARLPTSPFSGHQSLVDSPTRIECILYSPAQEGDQSGYRAIRTEPRSSFPTRQSS
jgi:hypothetical protein